MAYQPPSREVDSDAQESTRMATRVTRTLSAKGESCFTETYSNYRASLLRIRVQIDILVETSVSSLSIEECINLKTNLSSCLSRYEQEFESVVQYLESVKTQEGITEARKVRSETDDLRSRVERFIHTLDDHQTLHNQNVSLGSVRQSHVTLGDIGLAKADLYSQSNRSPAGSCCRSNVSRSSSLSSALIRQRAETEAAHVKLESAKREANILKQKAELEAKLNLLKIQTSVDEAEAKLKVLQDADGNSSRASSHEGSILSVTKRENTRKFVNSSDPLYSQIEDKSTLLDANISKLQPQSILVPPCSNAGLHDNSHTLQSQSVVAPQHTSATPYSTSSIFQPQGGLTPPCFSVATHNSFQPQNTFTPLSTGFVPPGNIVSQSQSVFGPPNSNCVLPNNNSIPVNHPSQFQSNNSYEDLANFLMKKEISLSRLHNFDDNPDTYSVWKAGFCDVTRKLAVSPTEEMDLLIKYLGPESKRQALSIRASNASNPPRGLSLIWERLEYQFASPEIIEASLKKKLRDFPKLSMKENKKLFDLSDILSEIEARKESDQYKNLLAYFDSSSGVSPIVSKLPFSMQEKWTNKASAYKEANQVPFPPFTFFSKFVRDTAKMRNDPSFCYEGFSQDKCESQYPSKPNKTVSFRSQNQVSVKKTETQKSTKQQSPKDQKKGRHCAYHDTTTHTLNYCRNFR